MGKLILVALLLVCASAAHADENESESAWALLGRSIMLGPKYPGPYEYIDVASIRVSGNIRRAWFKSVSPKLKPNDMSKTLSRTAFNCEDDTYRDEALVIVNANGIRDSIPASAYPTPWKPVVPDSQASFELHYICGWTPQ